MFVIALVLVGLLLVFRKEGESSNVLRVLLPVKFHSPAYVPKSVLHKQNL